MRLKSTSSISILTALTVFILLWIGTKSSNVFAQLSGARNVFFKFGFVAILFMLLIVVLSFVPVGGEDLDNLD